MVRVDNGPFLPTPTIAQAQSAPFSARHIRLRQAELGLTVITNTRRRRGSARRAPGLGLMRAAGGLQPAVRGEVHRSGDADLGLCPAFPSAWIASAIVPSRKAASPKATRCSSARPATHRCSSQMALNRLIVSAVALALNW